MREGRIHRRNHMPQRLNRTLLVALFDKANRDEKIASIFRLIEKTAVAETDEHKKSALLLTWIACCHILAKEHQYQPALKAHERHRKNKGLILDDIDKWITERCFAGHFDTFEEANSHGCGHYTVSAKQQPILDLSDIHKPLEIHALNTRYQRLHYPASLAIGKRKSINVEDLGGGPGSYYILLRRLFPDVHLRYTCIDFDESRPLNTDQIGNDFCHVPTIQQCKEANECDLLIASGVLQYIQDDALNPIKSAISSSRVTLIDRTSCTKQDSFWTIQTRTDSRHAFRIFNETELSDIASSNNNRLTLAEGICPEDFFNAFNMEEFDFEALTIYKWYITCKAIGISGQDDINLNEFFIS